MSLCEENRRWSRADSSLPGLSNVAEIRYLIGLKQVSSKHSLLATWMGSATSSYHLTNLTSINHHRHTSFIELDS